MAGRSHARTPSCEDVSDLKLLQCYTPSLLWFQVEVLRMLILPKHQQDTIFKQAGDHFVQKCSWRLHVHSVSTGVLAFCTKDSCVLTKPLFWLCDVRSRQQPAGAAVWYQQAAVTPVTKSRAAAIWTWERSARRWRGRASSSWGAPGSGLRAPGGRRCRCCAEKEEKHVRKEKRNQFILRRAGKYWRSFAACARSPHLGRRCDDRVNGGWCRSKGRSSTWRRAGMEMEAKAGMEK